MIEWGTLIDKLKEDNDSSTNTYSCTVRSGKPIILKGETGDTQKTIIIEENTEASYIELGTELAFTTIILKANAKLNYTLLCVGNQSANAKVNIELKESNASCVVRSLVIGNQHQQKNIELTVHHKKPHCESHIIARSVLDDASRSHFTGSIIVHKDASKTIVL